MSHKLVLEIPDEAYQDLVRSASGKGQSPEKPLWRFWPILSATRS